MRISKDATSWRAGGVLKRDARHTHGPPEEPRHASNKKKDTRRWCGGHVGREHKPECRRYEPDVRSVFTKWRLLVCPTCGKNLDWYCPSWDKKPDWVTF